MSDINPKSLATHLMVVFKDPACPDDDSLAWYEKVVKLVAGVKHRDQIHQAIRVGSNLDWLADQIAQAEGWSIRDCTLCKCLAEYPKHGMPVCEYHNEHSEDDDPCPDCAEEEGS